MADRLEQVGAALAGRYRVERELGAGGMATVYLAQDLKHDRKVAIKVMRPEVGMVIGAGRFLNEIRLTASLSHPHILPLHDSGEVDGILYYVMPFVEGESLRDRLHREQQLPIEDALHITLEAADALGYAHSRGVVHRDIKPENVLLVSGHALVADFGIALAVEEAGGDRLTLTGVSIGTPAYMSPEQAAGQRQVDGRTDIYSLACVLYEMLAGEPPYTGMTTQAIVAKRLADPVPSVRRLRETTPPAVDQALTKALAKVPSDRFVTVNEFVEALKQPVASPAARVVTLPRRVRAPFRREVAGVLSVLLLVAVGWWLWRAFPRAHAAAPLIESLVVLPPDDRVADSAHALLAAGLHDALITELNKVRGLAVISRTTARSYANSARALSQIAAELDVDGAAETSVSLQGDSVFMQVRLFQGTPERLIWTETFGGATGDMVTLPRQVAAGLASATGISITSRERELLSRSRRVDPEAWELYQQGKYLLDQLSHESVLAAEAVARRAIAKDPGLAEAHALLSAVLQELSFWKDAPPMDLVLEAERAASRALELDSTLAAAAVNRLNMLSGYTWDWDAQDAGFRRIIDLNPGSVEAHTWYGVFLAMLGRMKEAVRHTADAVRLDPVSLSARNAHTMALTFDGRFDDAVVQAHEILKLNRNYPVAYTRLAVALTALGQKDSAVAAMQRGYALDPEAPLSKGQMASIYALAGRTVLARALLDTLLNLESQRWVAPTIIAQVYNDLGVPDSAISWLEKAYAVRDPPLTYHLRVASPAVRSSPRFLALLRRTNLAR